MIDLTKMLTFVYERYEKNKDFDGRNKIFRYAILAEAKLNNDLASIILREKSNNVLTNYPKLFNEFSTTMSEVLLTCGVPACVVFDESSQPKEKNISGLSGSKSSLSLFEMKSASELFEFYNRKCQLVKSLCNSDSLNLKSVSLGYRIRNIEYATRTIIKKLE